MDVSGIMDAPGCCCNAPEVMEREANAKLLLHQKFYVLVHPITAKANSLEGGKQEGMSACLGKLRSDYFDVLVNVTCEVFVDHEVQCIRCLGLIATKVKGVSLRLSDQIVVNLY